MSEIYKRNILKLLKHADYEPLKFLELAKELKISDEELPIFKKIFEQLRQAGHVIVGAKGTITLPAVSGQVLGTFRANAKGFGFVIPRDPNIHGDLFIPPDSTANAMTGDTVLAKVVRQTKSSLGTRSSGMIVEILERAHNRFVGTLLKKAHGWEVEPDGTAVLGPVLVEDIEAKNAQNKDKVVVEMITFATAKNPARGVIVEVLGRAGQYEVEISSIVHQYHIPQYFPQQCLDEAAAIAQNYNPDSDTKRLNLTKKIIITIDPPDAKDFDDAISLEKDARGNWVLGVHIADVSSFVLPESQLDIEAKERGNSVYLPGKTIPMLPEVLSNGVCSLQPGQKRFCKSAFITYDQQGAILNRKYASSIICSTQRLTYLQADKILKGHTKDISNNVVELLQNMNTLSRIIEKRRDEDGTIHLDLPETELIMDKAGRVVDAQPAENSYPHTIIEMFMVEANEAVAELFNKLKVDFMRRIHPDPDILTLRNLSQTVKAFGYSIPRTPDKAAIQSLLAAVKKAECSFAVNMLVLRSFEKAAYSPLQIGHFALASANYCHFTSPIRRYADLLIHRQLQAYIENPDDIEKIKLHDVDLTEFGRHITFTEERAQDAEWELKAVLILQMLQNHIGDIISGVVTGLTNFGVFVRCKKFGIEGLIPIQDLGPDEWEYYQKGKCIVGKYSGFTLRLGMAIEATIASVNVPARQLSLVPKEPLVSSRKRGKKKVWEQKHKKSRPGKNQNRRRR